VREFNVFSSEGVNKIFLRETKETFGVQSIFKTKSKKMWIGISLI